MNRGTMNLKIFLFVVMVGFIFSCPIMLLAEGKQFNQSNQATVDTSQAQSDDKILSPYSGADKDERRHIDISLDNMDIYPLLDYVLGQIVGANYVVDPAIKGTISLKIKGDYTRDEFLNIFNSILQIHGLAITRGAHDLYKIVRKPNNASSESSIIKAGARPPHAGDIIRVYQLKYLSATQVISNLKNFVSPGAVMLAEPSINAIFLVDTEESASRVSKILALMDTDFFKDIHWRLFSLEHTDVSELEKDLKSIFKEKGLYVRPGIDTSGLQIVALKSINSILVITKWDQLLDVVAHWVEELDKGQSEKGVQVHVYFVQNGQAKNLADLLKQIYGGKPSSKSTSNKTIIVKRKETIKKSSATAPSSAELSGEVEIIPDEVNNALVIKARPKDYAVISKVLKQIDVVPRQVLIDVLILEVTLNDKVEYGVEWFLKNRGLSIDGKPYTGNIVLSDGTSLAQNTLLGEGISGLTYSLFSSAGDLRALLRVLADKTNVNILSAPNILALDNQESVIEAGDDVPTLTGTTTTTGGTVTQSIQYRNAGIILTVKPYINDSGLVRMEVTQEVSKVFNETTGGINSPRFTTRKAKTNLVAHDGQTVLIGGLMQTQKERTTTGIPVLKDLPVLGYLFGSRGYKTEKTELLIAITPHVIKSKKEADEMTREFYDRVKSLKDMLGHQGLLKEPNSEGTE